ncbi:MAG: tryptophan 2,3-dioxygenase family protein [Chitinophagales bacterium]
MNNNDQPLSDDLVNRINQLKEKYQLMGQDMHSYLEGLLYQDYLKYWDYINLDALLSLQHPRTTFPDEKTFIIYHQITELNFRLIRNAIELIADAPLLTADFFIKQIKRVNNIFEMLKNSFSVMYDGMDREQFLAFRMALLPASGFQSGQYRIIEMYSTDLRNLVHQSKREEFTDDGDPVILLPYLYWRHGAIELATGRKTLMLRQFEEKYDNSFIFIANDYRHKNLRRKYNALSESEKNNVELKEVLRRFDQLANVEWPLVHFRTATRYLDRKPDEIAATGGTNWKDYMPPKNQLIMFFPELWSDEEKENWGRNVSKEAIGL